MSKRSDTERIEWLSKQSGSALVSDDHGRWAISCSGFQPLSEERDGCEVLITEEPIGGEWVQFLDADDWRGSIRNAIDAAMDAEDEGTG